MITRDDWCASKGNLSFTENLMKVALSERQ